MNPVTDKILFIIRSASPSRVCLHGKQIALVQKQGVYT
jgi:hypothetical protein